MHINSIFFIHLHGYDEKLFFYFSLFTIKQFSLLVCLVVGSMVQSTSIEHEKMTKHSIDFSLSYSFNNPMCKNKFSKKFLAFRL